MSLWIIGGLFFLMLVVNWPKNQSVSSASLPIPTQKETPKALKQEDSALGKQQEKKLRTQRRIAIISSIRKAGYECKRFSKIKAEDFTSETYKITCSDSIYYRMQFQKTTQQWVVLDKILDQKIDTIVQEPESNPESGDSSSSNK